MILTHLSLQRAPRLHKQMPYTPTNAERLREFRVAMALRIERIGNEYRFPFHGGVVCKTAGNIQRQISAIRVVDSADAAHASTHSGDRQAEEYAREQAMDGAPDPINYAERRG